MKKVLIPLFICLLALVLIGCSSQTTSTATKTSTTTSTSSTTTTTTTQVKTSTTTSQSATTSTTAKPQSGGILRIIISAGPVAHGYPPASNPMDSSGTMGVMEGLIGVDGKGEPTPK